jgi:hypothetical protein
VRVLPTLFGIDKNICTRRRFDPTLAIYGEIGRGKPVLFRLVDCELGIKRGGVSPSGPSIDQVEDSDILGETPSRLM